MAFPVPSTIGANSVSASAATITPALPATLVNGNLLIAQVQIQSTGKIIATVTPGWTIIDSVNTGNISAAWAQAIMATGLVAPVFAWTGAAACQAQVNQYSGNAAGGTGAKANATANASTTITTGALTTTADNSLVLNILLTSTNQTIPLLSDRTNITTNATVDGSTRQCFGQVGKSGSVTDNPSDTITSANWVSFSIEVLGTGTGVAATERTSQVVQSTLESYSNPPVVRTSQVVLSTMESYSTPVIQVHTSQVVISVLRSVSQIINFSEPTSANDAFTDLSTNIALLEGASADDAFFVSLTRNIDFFEAASAQDSFSLFVSTADLARPRIARDWWDRDALGRFFPGAGYH